MSCRARWSLLLGLPLIGLVPLIVLSADPPRPVPVEEQDFSAELPRIVATEKDRALETLRVQPGFRVEQIAAEPLVNSPVAMAWDENGRLYVVEMRGYSEDREAKLSRISVLDDDDGDGRYDRATHFAEELLWPTAIACWQGGVFVADAPHIYYLKDLDGDGRADTREIVYTGFSTSNVQGLLNSFHFTLDNRIHGSASSTGGEITRPDAPDVAPVNVRGRDFEIDPRTRRLVATSGGAQHGMSFDPWGRKFVCSNSDHIQQVMFEDRYVARNPHFSPPSARVSIAADGPQAEVFRASPVEPWRIVRTRLRVSGAVKGAVEGGGRASGYFTGATGVTIFRGDALPSAAQEWAFVGDVGSNLVHRKQLTLEGVQYVARRIDDQSEFVASTDTWFRPAQFYFGPDGALTIADVYREVIEHPASIPPMIKKHLDLTSGRERGRLYRVVPEGFQPRPTPRLGKASVEELVGLLGHPNGWHRETAARLIYERQDSAAIAPLEKLASSGESPLGRMHALYALDGLGRLRAAHVTRGLSDPHPRVREHAIRLAERVSEPTAELFERLFGCAQDADAQVRYQLAFTLGQFPGEAARRAWVTLARRDAADRWMRVALLSSLVDRVDLPWLELLADASFREEPANRPLFLALATLISRRDLPNETTAALSALKPLATTEAPLTLQLVRAFYDGQGKHARTGLSAPEGIGRALLGPMIAEALKVAADGQRPSTARVEAVRSLSLAEFPQVRPLLSNLLDTRQPQELQLAALTTLDRFTDPDVAAVLVDAWPILSPRLKSAAGDALFARPERLPVLLDALEGSKFAPAELDAPKIQRLLTHSDPTLQARAKQILGSVTFARRQDVVEQYRPALSMTGDFARGKQIFGKICAACHRLENVGHEIGPSLAAMKNRGPEAILLNVLDPSREVNPQFVNYLCIVDDGRILSGMIAAESATSLTLRRAENQQDTVLRLNIEELRSSGLSIMPEGLEKQIDLQGMADVITYLMQAN